jgi:hypothetical protein
VAVPKAVAFVQLPLEKAKNPSRRIDTNEKYFINRFIVQF